MTRLALFALLISAGIVCHGDDAQSPERSAKDPRRYALIVGVRQYRPQQPLPRLEYTENDAHELADALTDVGFDVTLMTQQHAREADDIRFQPNADMIQDELNALLANPLGPEDVVLIVFAGHGVQFPHVDDPETRVDESDGEPEFYFCPADADILDVEHVDDVTDGNGLLSIDAIYEQLDACRAGLRVLVTDACRNDPNQPSNVRSPATTALPELSPTPDGVAVLFSCSSAQRAWEDKDLGAGHGVYMHYFIEGLRGPADINEDQRITVAEIHNYVSETVPDYVRQKFGANQHPYFSGELMSEVLVRLGESPRTSLPSADRSYVADLYDGFAGQLPEGWEGTDGIGLFESNIGVRMLGATNDNPQSATTPPLGFRDDYCLQTRLLGEGPWVLTLIDEDNGTQLPLNFNARGSGGENWALNSGDVQAEGQGGAISSVLGIRCMGNLLHVTLNGVLLTTFRDPEVKTLSRVQFDFPSRRMAMAGFRVETIQAADEVTERFTWDSTLARADNPWTILASNGEEGRAQLDDVHLAGDFDLNLILSHGSGVVDLHLMGTNGGLDLPITLRCNGRAGAWFISMPNVSRQPTPRTNLNTSQVQIQRRGDTINVNCNGQLVGSFRDSNDLYAEFSAIEAYFSDAEEVEIIALQAVPAEESQTE